MLEYLRKHSKSVFIKALFLLLILSFVAWGVTGFSGMQLGGGPRVAEVGDVTITPQYLHAEYMRELNRLHMIFGRNITSDEAKALGVVDGVLGKVVSETLFDLSAADLGVTISDVTIRQAIMGDKRFQGADGNFDRTRFEEFLQFMGYSEIAYTEIRRQELARWQVAGTVGAGAEAPKHMVDTIYRFRNEERVAEVFKVADTAMTGLAEPTDEQLKAFHEEFADQFTAPEYRKLTVVRIEAADLAEEMAVSDAEIQESYTQRESEFNLPERREIEQILVQPDQKETIQRIAERIAAGTDFEAAGNEIAGEGAVSNIGLVSRNFLLAELAEAAFALPIGKVSGIVESPLGWHLLRVTRIESARRQTIDEVRDALSNELAKDKAIDALFDLSNRLEDILGGGATLEEAANQLNLKISTIDSIDANGLSPAGEPVANVPPGDKFLPTAFETENGMDSLLTEAGQEGYFVLRVDGVTPSTLRLFETVRDAVAAGWAARERASMAEKKAEALARRAGAGELMDVLASSVDATVRVTDPFKRAESNPKHGLSRQMVTDLFTAKIGEAVFARTGDGYLVGRLANVIEANPGADAEGVDAMAQQISGNLRNDLRSGFARALESEHGVQVYQKALDELL